MKKIVLLLLTILFLHASLLQAQSSSDQTEGSSDVQNTKQVNESIQYPSFKGVALSIFPGVLLHGSGHYLTGEKDIGLDLLILEGASLGCLVGGITVLALVGGSGILSPVIIPIITFGGVTFLSSWFFDILGTAGLSQITHSGHPDQMHLFELSYIFQEDYQSPYHSFLKSSYQWANEDNVINLSYQNEITFDYQKFQVTYGHKLLQGDLWNLYVMPRFLYEISHENFSISRGDISLKLDINLGAFWHTLHNIYFENSLGYGRQWFHFSGKGVDLANDFSTGTMILHQGLRFHFSHAVVGVQLNRTTENMVAGNDYSHATYRYYIEPFYKKFYTRFEFNHARGFNLFFVLGVKL